ncbi:MAG: DNA polymerase III subunit beta [Patescibacteria group bacterium]
MKLVCTQENLSKAISQIERVTGRQATLPILSNFLLETEKGRLKLSATNLEIGVVAYIGAKIEREGKITIPAKLLGNFIHNLPGGEVVALEVDNQQLKIESVGYSVKIKGMDGKDFPIIPQFQKEYFFSLPAQELKSALSRLLFCVSTNEARLELTGINLTFLEKELHLAATDSFRLAEEIIPLGDLGKGYTAFQSTTSSFILPSATLNEISRIISPESTEVKVALEENQIFFEVDNIQVISRLINGKYPDYKQIIPSEFSLEVSLEKDLLQRAIRIASSFSSYNSGEIALVFHPIEKTCTIVSQSQEIGENTSVLDIETIRGEAPLTLVFNPRYVLEGIGVLTGDRVAFLANTGTSPAAFRMLEGGSLKQNYLYILMPIRK